MGNPNTKSTGNRYGVQGPSEEREQSGFFDGTRAAAPAAVAAASAPPPRPGDACSFRDGEGDGRRRRRRHEPRAAPCRRGDDRRSAMKQQLDEAKPSAPARPQTIDNEGRFEGKDRSGYLAGDLDGNLDVPNLGVDRRPRRRRRERPGLRRRRPRSPRRRALPEAGSSRTPRPPKPGPTTAFRQRVVVDVSEVPHFAIRCGAAAFVPFEEKVQLWHERLLRVTGNAPGVASVYRRALGACEAPTWRERSKLLALLLDAMPGDPGEGRALADDVLRARRGRRALPQHPRAREDARRGARAPRRARPEVDRSRRSSRSS